MDQTSRCKRLGSLCWVFIALALTHQIGGIEPQPLDVAISAPYAVVIDGETGALLFEQEGNTPCCPASTTKIVTALVVLDQMGDRLDQEFVASANAIGSVSYDQKVASQFTLPSHWLEQGGCHINIKKGERLTLETLLHGLLLESANDAANVLAEAVGGSIDAFVEQMNQKVQALGCSQTRFMNPHGLGHPDHQSTAYEMAHLMRLALHYPMFRTMIGMKRAPRPQTNLQEASELFQHNALILPNSQHYDPRVLGGKTGYIARAGCCLVAAAEAKGRTVIVSLMGGKSCGERYCDIRALLDAALNEEPQWAVAMPAGLLKTSKEIEGKSVTPRLATDLVVPYYPSEGAIFSGHIDWLPLQLPIKKGEMIGHIILSDHYGRRVGEQELVADCSIKKSPGGKLAIASGVIIGWAWLLRSYKRSQKRKSRR